MEDSVTGPVYSGDRGQMRLAVTGSERLQAAIGRVAMRHAQLDHVLRLAMKSLRGLTYDAALSEYGKHTTERLLRELERIASTVLSGADDMTRCESLVARARVLNTKRNRLMHDASGLSESGEEIMLQLGRTAGPMPEIETVSDLEHALHGLCIEFNSVRLTWTPSTIGT